MAASNIVKSCYTPKLATIDIAQVIDVIAGWRMMVGSTKNPDADQINLEAVFLKNNYSHLSREDVTNAIDAFLNNRLDIDVPEFVSFSTLHISRVMNSYLRYKSKVVAELDSLSEKQTLSLENTGAPQANAKAMQEMISECSENAKHDFKDRFYNTLVYDFLRKTKRLSINEQLAKGARKYAEKKYKTEKEEIEFEKREKRIDPLSIQSRLDMRPAKIKPEKDALRDYGIDYCLIEFFKSADLNKVIEDITAADFTPKPAGKSK